MKNIRPKIKWLLYVFPGIIALVGALLFLLPQLFQLPLVQEKTSAFISRQIPGDFSYREGTLSIFPTPRIYFYNVRLDIGDRFSVGIDQISATPHFFSLLRGKVNISKLSVDNIYCDAELPESAIDMTPEIISILLRQQLETVGDILGSVKQKKFMLDISNSTLVLNQAGKPTFSFQDIGGSVTWRYSVLSLDVTCQTELWHQCRFVVDTDILTGRTSCRLAVEDFIPGPIYNSVFSGAPYRVEEGTLDANLSWETAAPGTWHLSVEAITPNITFSRDETRFNLQGKKAVGEIHRNETGLRASISELDLDNPDLHLTGEFDLNTENPFAGWQVKAESLDIASSRTAALFFADRFITTRNITRILQGGEASRLTLGQKANTLEGLKKTATFYLQGHLDNTSIFIPKPDLLLTDASGDITVSDAILTGSDLETRLGNSEGSRGDFTLALTGGDPRPWTVACDIQADLAQLPQLLGHLARNTVFRQEMAAIESADGTAKGTMALNHSTEGLQVMVDVSKFDLSAVYHRIPFPVVLSGNRFRYRSGEIQVQGVQGNIGDSRLSDLDAGLTWKAAPQLSISSARGEVNTDELASWLDNTLTAGRIVKKDTTDTGRLQLTHLRFDGPLHSPLAWRFQTNGYVVAPFTFLSPLFPEALTFHQGDFTATQEKIEIDKAELSVQGSRFATAGSLEGWFAKETPWILDIRLEGSLDREDSDWIHRLAKIPNLFRWSTPISVSPLSLRWHETEGISISGEASIPDGPRLSLSISDTLEGMTVDNLTIMDADDLATISVTRDKNDIVASFSGNLGNDTVSKILADNHLLSGSIQGKADTRINLSPPYFDSITGRLRATGLDLTPTGLPLLIERASLTGDGTSARIDDLRFTLEENPFSSSGQVTRSEQGLLLDLSLAAEQLDWHDVKALVADKVPGRTASAQYFFGDIRFTCDRFSLTQAWTFEPFEAHLKLEENRSEIEFRQADVCGISFPGTLSLMPGRMMFAFHPSAEQQPLETSIACLSDGKAFIDGRFDLTGDIEFQWDHAIPLLEAAAGSISLSATDGRIYKGSFLGKLFSMLNVSEVLLGQFPDFEKEGFRYKTSTFKGTLDSGKFELETGVIDGPAMKLFFEGVEDIINRQHDLTVVMAPLKTIDTMVNKIPVLNDVLEKGLVVYPVDVTGSWEDPQLILLSPTAVGDEVLGIMLRTLKVPVTLFEKILREKKTGSGKDTP